MNRKVLAFNDWRSTKNPDLVEEGAGYDKAINWLSKKFGGKVSKLDDILDDIKKVENEYVDEWEDIISDIDSLEVEKEQTKSDPAERKKIDRILSRKEKVLDALTKKHSSDLKKLKTRGQEMVQKTDRLKAYWDLELSNLESDLAEDMYKKAKSLSSDTTADELYRKYRSSMERAKKKDSAFRSKYGSLISFKYSKGDSEASMEKLLDMTHESFENRVKSMDSIQLKKLVKYIRKERNEKYAVLDKEKESLMDKIKASPESKEEVSKELKEISMDSMEKIRDLRTKITIANRYV